MRFLYTIFIALYDVALRLARLFNPKAALFVNGRQAQTFHEIATICQDKYVVWMHVSSLGEFEQGKSLLQKIKEHHPHCFIVITFFSPSGFEAVKETSFIDLKLYLPLDYPSNALKFIDALNPKLAIMVKYDVWPNYMRVLKQKGIPSILVSAHFRPEQVYFKWYGYFFRDALKAFNHIYVQTPISMELLRTLGYLNVSVIGDTRFDSIIDRKKQSIQLRYPFKSRKPMVVLGSVWPSDMAVLRNGIEQYFDQFNWVVAPHDVHQPSANIWTIDLPMSKWSDKTLPIKECVLYLDTIGLLKDIYQHAAIVYVGGGFHKPGIHNIVEPAVYGTYLSYGPQHQKHQEAIEMAQLQLSTIIHNANDWTAFLGNFITNTKAAHAQGQKAAAYVLAAKGATLKVYNDLLEKNFLSSNSNNS